MQNSDNHYLLEIFLADLKSDEKFIRELAIFQLHHHIEIDKVRAELKAAAETESDPYLKAMVESLLASTSQVDVSLAGQSPPPVASSDELLQQWRSRELSDLPELIRQIALLPTERQESAIRQLICEENEMLRLIPLFSFKHELIRRPQTIATLAKMLVGSDQLFVIRLIPFLAEHGREHLIKALPNLLKHQNFMIRAESIRFLFKISRKHALRLLEELIFANAASRKSASTFLLLFPFEDVQNIVLSLIDSGSLQDPFLYRLITYLVANNPDPNFFKRLTVMQVLRGDDIPELEKVRREAAESLKIAGLMDEDIEAFCSSSLERVSEYIKDRSGIKIVPAAEGSGQKAAAETIEATATVATEPAKADKTPTQKPVMPAKAEQIGEANVAKLQEMLAKSSLSDENRMIFRRMLMEKQPENLNELILKVIAKFKPSDSQAIKWLEDNLESTTVRDRLLTIKLLADLNPARLLPHLPVLCVSENEMITTQAIRLFRKHNLKGLLKQINNWLNEDRERSWKSALNALLQIKIETSREILLKTFKTTNRTSLIKYFAPVFRISPDHITLFELELMSAENRGSKHELLEEMVIELKEALGVATQKDGDPTDTTSLLSAGIHVKWNELRQSLDKIRYISKNELLGESLINFGERHIAKALIVTAMLFIYTFWPDNSLVENQGPEDPTITQKFEINQPAAELKPGDHKIFKLESYDPINRSWRATGLDGKVYKLKVPVPGDFTAGFKGDFKILYYSVTRLGYPVVVCDLVSKEK
ncbi:MAG: hypothetical protein GQF41_0750 [Candidatus Rifleibacterium amylolyticum]|nr:MAG: hypothetical protein GQF41_0750 [Candidatus Rifleibacterium amylolyticum]